jgi:hypothetical protein
MTTTNDNDVKRFHFPSLECARVDHVSRETSTQILRI